MKTFCQTAAIGAVLLLIFGYSAQPGDQLTQAQQENIKKEITGLWDTIIARSQRLDAAGVLQFYSPAIVAFSTDGVRTGFEEIRKYFVDFCNSATLNKWTPFHLEFIVVAKDKVVISVDGKTEYIFKSGNSITYNPSHYTIAFAKSSGQWKVVYYHFSGFKEK